MDTMIFLTGVTALIAINALLAILLGWLFTEVVRIPLNFKPFTCRPCLTFWFTFILGVVLAFVLTPYFPGIESTTVRMVVTCGLIGVAVLSGLISYQYIKLKFRIYE